MERRSQQHPNFRTNDFDKSKVEHVNCLLSSVNDNADEVSRAISSLTDAELAPFGLKAFRINLLSVLGDLMPAEQVVDTARKAAINKIWLGWEYFYDYLPRLAEGQKVPHLEDLPIVQVRELLARGRGLVIASFHQGHYRHLASDLAIAGVPVCMPLAADAFEHFNCASETVQGSIQDLIAVNVEEIRGSFKLARVLSAGGCVCATIDGNTGLDGVRGDSHRTVVDILGCQARVKTGLIRMAAACGAPILPLFALTVNGRQQCLAAPVIDPGRRLSREEADSFSIAAVRQLYSSFAERLRSFPEQWNGCDQFHLWRVPSPLTDDHELASERLERDLKAGGMARVDLRRIVDLSRDEDQVWADAKTLQCYRLPVEMQALVARLCSRDGVDLAWLGCATELQQSRMWTFMRQLAGRGAIQSRIVKSADDGPDAPAFGAQDDASPRVH